MTASQQTPLQRKKVFLFKNLQEFMPDIYGNLEASGWLYFVDKPIKALTTHWFESSMLMPPKLPSSVTW